MRKPTIKHEDYNFTVGWSYSECFDCGHTAMGYGYLPPCKCPPRKRLGKVTKVNARTGRITINSEPA